MRQRDDEILQLQQALRKAFAKIKEEAEEHLTAINENTNEIQSNYEYLCRLEARIDKLDEKISDISLFLEQFRTKKTYSIRKIDGSSQEFQVRPLTQKEMQVFLVLYTVEEPGKITYQDIAKKLSISESLAQNYITNLIEKGIPITKQYLNRIVFLKLDNDFKALQAKKNVLNINEGVREEVV